jgi:hypothetical protein
MLNNILGKLFSTVYILVFDFDNVHIGFDNLELLVVWLIYLGLVERALLWSGKYIKDEITNNSHCIMNN